VLNDGLAPDGALVRQVDRLVGSGVGVGVALFLFLRTVVIICIGTGKACLILLIFNTSSCFNQSLPPIKSDFLFGAMTELHVYR
jgi:hypothetical protein